MSRIAILLMPWGRVGSNLVNSVVQKSKSRRVWNEPLTGVQTRVINSGGTLDDVWPEQLKWLQENIANSDQRIFLNVAANSVGDPAAFRDFVQSYQPQYLVLDRKDDLATLISALRTEAWVREGLEIGEKRSWSIPSGQSVSFQPHIAPERVSAAYDIIKKGRHNIGVITNGIAISEFFYEDLCIDMASTMRAILSAADIPDYDFAVSTGKFGSESLSSMISNPEEIREIVDGIKIYTNLQL